MEDGTREASRQLDVPGVASLAAATHLAVPALAVLLLLPASARPAPGAAQAVDPKRRVVTRLFP